MRGIGFICGLAAITLLVEFVAAAQTEVVTYKTEDRLTITGDLWATGRTGAPAVVALHMYPADRKSWEPVARRFQKAGIDFLAIDMRGYGDSRKQRGKDLSEKVQARNEKHFRSMWKDALGAYEFLVKRGSDPGQIAFLGASVGCSVAIDAAAREPRILGAAVLTPGANYLGVETMKHLEGYGDRPLLILSSAKAVEVLIPRRLEGLSRKGAIKIALGLALKKGNHLSALPLNDNALDQVGRWLDYGLPE